MNIVARKNLFFLLSSIVIIPGIVSLILFGLKQSIDFTGGSKLEISVKNPDKKKIEQKLRENKELQIHSIKITGENISIRINPIDQKGKAKILTELRRVHRDIKENSFETVGPSIGQETKANALKAVLIASVAITLYIAFAFRKVSFPVSSWKYGLSTIIALAHDVIIPTGIYVAWAHYRGGEIDLLFVTALLAILGYSVHDTIVVFDRVRENLRLVHDTRAKETFIETVGKSVTQTFGRSINTSLTIFLALIALYFIGGEATRNFAFVLLIGVVAGTYSSIFIASTLLVTLEKLQSKNNR